MLEIKNLKVYFKSEEGTVYSVNGVDLSLSEAKTTALVGESGSGKSVTSLSIMGLLDKKSVEEISGEIIFKDMDLLKLDEESLRKLRGKEISMIFQEPMTSLNPAFKIGYQLLEVLKRDALKKSEKISRAKEMLKLVELDADRVFNSYPHELSGGMRQRVMIAMALLEDPKLLIADEPTTALDVTVEAEVLKLINRLKEQFKTAILFITHDLSVVAEVADYVNVMYAGKIVERADVFEIFKNPLHPYTIGLMKARPTSENKGRLHRIKGSVKDLRKLEDKCNFCDRCEHVMDICRRQTPPEVKLGEHGVSCFLYR